MYFVKKIKLFANASVLLGLAVLAFGTSLNAQEKTGAEDKLGPWIKVCPEDRNTSPCLITHEMRDDKGNFIASIAIREENSGTNKKQIIIAVPPGVLLREGLKLSIDKQEETTTSYAICFPNACYADAVINEKYISALKKGSYLNIKVFDQQAKVYPIQVSLVGFTKSYDGKAIDPKRFISQQSKLEEELKKRAEETRKKLDDGKAE